MALAPSTIFVLRVGTEESIILHPFGPGSPLYGAAGSPQAANRLEGRFAAGPGPLSFARLRAVLDTELEAGLRAYALERGFVLRVTASAAVFLVVYLFLSIVIRDPIPLFDELLGGGLAAFAVERLLVRRALRASRVIELGERLRLALGEAVFTESRVVAMTESWLEELFPATGLMEGHAALGSVLASGATFAAWLDRDPPSLSRDELGELGDIAELIARELVPPGSLGGTGAEAAEARAKELLRRLRPSCAPRGKRRRDLALAALYLKAQSVLKAQKGV